jgi:hypothetical protein
MDVQFSPSLSNHFNLLPTEIKQEVFKFIPVLELIKTTSLVCREWYQITNDNPLWCLIVEKSFPRLKSLDSSEYKQEFKEIFGLHRKNLYFNGMNIGRYSDLIQLGKNKCASTISITEVNIDHLPVFFNSKNLISSQPCLTSSKIFLNYIEKRYKAIPSYEQLKRVFANPHIRTTRTTRTNVHFSFSHLKSDKQHSDKVIEICRILTENLENKVTKQVNDNQKKLNNISTWEDTPASLFFDENGNITLKNDEINKYHEIMLKQVILQINDDVFSYFEFDLPEMSANFEAKKQIQFRAVVYRTIQKFEEKLNNCMYSIENNWNIPERDESGNLKFKLGWGFRPLK